LEGDRRMRKMKRFVHERAYEERSVNINILEGKTMGNLKVLCKRLMFGLLVLLMFGIGVRISVG
jgi:hypothetical protein